VKKLLFLRVGSSVDIFQLPFTEGDFEGRAKVMKIESFLNSGHFIEIDLIVTFSGDEDLLYRKKIYKC